MWDIKQDTTNEQTKQRNSKTQTTVWGYQKRRKLGEDEEGKVGQSEETRFWVVSTQCNIHTDDISEDCTLETYIM